MDRWSGFEIFPGVYMLVLILTLDSLTFVWLGRSIKTTKIGAWCTFS